MMNLSSVMGSEPLSIAYPIHQDKHVALYTLSFRMSCWVHSNVLTMVSSLVSNYQTTRSSPRRTTTRRRRTLRTTLRTRNVSWSVACRLRRDMGSTTMCFVAFRCVIKFACPAWQLSKTWSYDHLCKTFIICVMDDVIWMPTSVCCSRLIFLGSWMYAYGGS